MVFNDNTTLLLIPAFWLLRLVCFTIDLLASASYESCRNNCMGYFPPPSAPPPQHPPWMPPIPPGLPPAAPPYGPNVPPSPFAPPDPPLLPPPPPPLWPFEPKEAQCEGLLASISAVNCFALLALALIVTVRYLARERSYGEACLVTYMLVACNLLLQLTDATLPIFLTTSCFPDSLLPPFNSTLMGPNCIRPCMLGDLYAVYGLYAIGKALVGATDVLLCTGFLLRRPADWYRDRSATHARLTAGKL